MTVRATKLSGQPCWIDLWTSDAGRAREFYAELFDWTPGEASEEFGGYFMFMRGGAPICGAMPASESIDVEDQWSVYLGSADAGATVAAATTAGGTVAERPLLIADLGTQAVVTDPGGGRTGVWQAAAFPGFGEARGTGTPAWFELYTRDFEATVAFYRDVFGWEPSLQSDTDEFRYATDRQGDAARAGIMEATSLMPVGAPANWAVYFEVERVDAALATCQRLGGSVLEGASDTPYGRLARLADSTGAEFKVLER